MGKKRNQAARGAQRSGAEGGAAARSDQPTTLKDMLGADVLEKLKAQADSLKAEEERRRLEAAKEAEEARKAEQKRRESDFGYLLDNSKLDWKTFKR